MPKGTPPNGAAAENIPTPAGPWLRGKDAVAAHLGGVSVRTVDAWLSRGVLPVVRLPGSRLCLFRAADVDRAVARFASEARA